MFKRIFSIKRKKDIRFLPYEEYRKISHNKTSNIPEPTKRWMHPQDALKVNIESSDSSRRPILSLDQLSFDLNSQAKNNETDSYIIVEDDLSADAVNRNKTRPCLKFKNSLVDDKVNFSNSLGVFSDTKMYSALISSELQQYSLNLKYFNHPKNFVSNQLSFFDNISAWIVFLSEDTNEVFLETFIDRYIDKPCLFLFAKGNRSKTGQKVSRFLTDNGLIIKKPSSLLSEI